MVFLGSFVKISIINTHYPCHEYTSRNFLSLVILNHCYSPFLGYNVKRANPLIVGDGVNYPDFQEFLHLLFNHFFHVGGLVSDDVL